MSENRTHSPQSNQVTVTLEILPIEEEADDLDTLALARQIHATIQQEFAQIEGYMVSSLKESEAGVETRGVDLVLFITILGATIAAYKDLLTSFFQMIATLTEVLAKREHVSEIEIMVDGKVLTLHDVNKKTLQELIATFEAQHSRATVQLKPGAIVKARAKVSKRKQKK